MRSLQRAGILGVGSHVPEKVLTNADLERMVDTSDEWISSRTGIKERRISEEHETTAQYAAAAGSKALERAGIAPDDVDLIIVATLTPDMACPPTACVVQDLIGASKAAAFDLSAACSGFVYGLDVAHRMVETGANRHVLVIGVDLLSRVVDYTDRSTCVLFGDGAGAAVVGPVEKGGLLSTYLGADGGRGSKLTVGGPAAARACGVLGPEAKKHAPSDVSPYIKMEGNDVFKFAVTVMPEAALEALKRADVSPDDVALFIPHQANIRIIDAAAKRLGIDRDRVFVNVERYGNTSAASIPLALDEALDKGVIDIGDKLVLVGFGGGLTWAAAVMEWSGERVGRG